MVTADALLAKLRAKQQKHRRRLHEVEMAAAEFARASQKLQALESEIADLEQRLSEPREKTLGTEDPKDGPLRPAVLVFNPCGGQKHDNAVRLAHVVARLRAHGVDAEVKLKTTGKAARRHVREAVKAGVGLVVAAGGDGTLQDVASQLVGTDTALGIIPTGTSNDVARALGIPLDIDAACALIGMGTTRHLDMGRLLGDGRKHREYFLDIAGIGLMAVAALAGQSFRKGQWKLFPKAIRQLFEVQQVDRIRVELDGVLMEPATRLVTVANCPLTGPRVLIAPEGKMDDGWLDVAVYDGLSDAQLAAHFAAAKLGKDSGLVPTYKAKRVRIHTPNEVPINTDMSLPEPSDAIEIVAVPRALRVIVGNGIGLTVPNEAAPPAEPFESPPAPLTRKDKVRPPESG